MSFSNKTPLNQQSGMPQMAAAFRNWMITLYLIRIEQRVTEGFVEQVETPIRVQGTWQPLSPDEIKLKPDGQRSWEWIDLHIVGKTMVFATNDRVSRDGIRYKVMAVKDWTLNNYSEYHLVLDYQDE